MQEFIEYLKAYNETWTTEHAQEVELELDESILLFLTEFAREQGVCLDALVGACTVISGFKIQGATECGSVATVCIIKASTEFCYTLFQLKKNKKL